MVFVFCKKYFIPNIFADTEHDNPAIMKSRLSADAPVFIPKFFQPMDNPDPVQTQVWLDNYIIVIAN